MPSQLHESHLLLFRNQPALAAALIRGALGGTLPAFREARDVSADLTEVQPAEYRADMVIELWSDRPVHGIIVEVQLSRSARKRFVWPAYVANLHARLKCPVSLLVVTPHERVARWAAKPVHMGGDCWFAPYVVGPSGIPEVTDQALALDNPELAVLSAMAHGLKADPARAIEIALAARHASAGLDADRADLYVDLIINSLSEAARRALMNMDLRKHKYRFQSVWAREQLAEGVAQGVAQGRAEGEIRGRAALVMRLLTARFGHVAPQVDDRIQHASIAELDAIGERLLTARTLQEAIGA
jgi:uncharacterized protein DUF4351